MKPAARQNRARKAALELKRREERRQLVFGSPGEHPLQDDFVSDSSPLVLASCSRRAGKSYGTARKIIKAMERFPRSMIPYIVQAREQAKDIIWPALQDMDIKFDLGLRFKENTGEVVHPNKSRLKLFGGGTKREIEKVRGGGTGSPFAVIDEAQSFAPSLLQYLVEDVLDACLMDYGKEAQMCLIGTPNAACAGYFYDLIKAEKYPHYHWTCLDNPFLPDVEEFLERKRQQLGGETPTFLREYRGIWVRDENALVFRLNDTINLLDRHEEGTDWTYTLGIDFGFNDPTAFVVLGYSRLQGRIDVVESFEETELTQGRIAAYVQELDDKYHFASMVGDSQGYGKPLVEGLNSEYGLAVKAAKKREKAAQIEMLNSDLRTGTLRLVKDRNADLVDQMRYLQWDPDKLKENKFAFLDSKFPDHLADALVYAYRDIHVHDDWWEERDPVYGSPEWEEAREEQIITQRVQRLEREREELEWFDEFGGSDGVF